MTASTAPARLRAHRRPGDAIFSGAALTGGLVILVALAAVAVFLVAQSLPAFGATPQQISSTGEYANFWAYVVPLAFGTVWAALLALLFAVPFSIAIALFTSHYAPRRIARGLGAIVDLLAAIPSVVYGAWGIFVFAPFVQPFYVFLNEAFRLVPAVQRQRVGLRAHHPHRRDGAGRDGHPDHHRALARDLPADAPPERGGGARARRHPLGDDADGGAAVRPRRRRVRRHARPRPRARRDPRGRDGALPQRRRRRSSCCGPRTRRRSPRTSRCSSPSRSASASTC